MSLFKAYLSLLVAILFVNEVFSNVDHISEDQLKSMVGEPKPVAKTLPDDGHVSSELIKEKFGIDMGEKFKATSFSKDAAAKLAAS